MLRGYHTLDAPPDQRLTLYLGVLIGAHESVAGGLVRALERADAHRVQALQIWTSSGTRWAPVRRDPGEVREFAGEIRRRQTPLLAHGSYLVNLAATGPLKEKSRGAFVAELERAEELGVGAVVIHPGAHCGAGVEAGMRRIAAGVRYALQATRGYRVKVLLELTAGQGTCLGASFTELAALLRAIDVPSRTGVCFDTQHAFAVGYDLRGEEAYEAVWRQFDRVIGLGRLEAFHLNDSKRELGSRVDRHAAIGEGAIGDAAFRRLVRDPRFDGVPALLEMPPAKVDEGIRKLGAWRRMPRKDGAEATATRRR